MTRLLSPRSALAALTLLIITPRVTDAQRRGTPGVITPMTEVSVALGGTVVTGSVDAKCGVDDRATPGNTRAYFSVMYPWFGQRVASDKPQWRLNLEIRRGTTTEASNQFVFSFLDGQRSGTIQTVAGSERMGGGSVKVTRQGKGARFELDGRTKEGDTVRATIVCSAFQRAEAPGG